MFSFFKKKSPKKTPKMICYCFQIPEKEIQKLLSQHHCQTVEDLQKYCRASQGCGGCRPEIEEIIKKKQKKV